MPVSTPTIDSNGGGDTAAITINEGVTAVTTVVGSDLDGDTLTYSLVGGADRFKFKIDAVTGALTFIAPPDFEAPTDSALNGSNTYQVIVRVSDGDLFDTQTITVTIGDVAPVTINGTSGDDLTLGVGTATVEGDTLNGLGGADILNGGLGADTMNGGNGSDTYMVDNVGDIASEGASTGNDTVISSVTYTITDVAIENLTLTGTAALNATGNASNNTLTGNQGANILNGAGGTDIMIGGLGNDVYITDGGDTITEGVGEGTDRVESSVTLTLGANLENLTLTGASAINGTGNELNNVIIGNVAANTLTGLAGNDELNGGAGADTMVGGLGNDTYIVDNSSDVVTEVNGEGIDIVESSVTFDLRAGVDKLLLTGTAAINGTGNGLANTLTGNSAINTLTGAGGNDILDGKAGNDVMIGGLGDDTYYIDSLSDTVTEAASEGTDTVITSVSGYTLGSDVENVTLAGSATTATGNALNNILKGNSAANTLTGNGGNDTLDGQLGIDVMIGGDGNDVYIVNTAGETTTEGSGLLSGVDTVKSSVTWTLGANVENLTLGGFSTLNGTGNELDNVIKGNIAVNTLTGNDGNDTLNGDRGIDTMIGGNGDDTYYVQDTKTVSGVTTTDIVTEGSGVGSGTDTVISTLAAYTLGANVENLTLGGSASNAGTGNELDNVLTGNKGANTLNGAAGADTINGGIGADTIIGGIGKDTMTGGADIDTFVFTSLSESSTSASTADMITDFAAGEHITLTAIDARADLATDQAFIMDTNGVFVAGEIGVTVSGGVATVSLYTDGVAGADMVFKVTLTGGLTTLIASDFDL